MNALGIALVWCALQVTLACVAGVVVFLLAKMLGWAAGRVTTITSLTLVLALSVATLSPWPSWLPTAQQVSASSGLNVKQSSLPENGQPIAGVDSIAQ